MKVAISATAFLCLIGFAPQQVEQKDIDAAIKKGADFLLKTFAGRLTEQSQSHELVIYTLIHADADPTQNALVKDGIEKLITLTPDAFGNHKTYRTAIQALALHSLLLKIRHNPAYAYLDKRVDAIQERIALCGQFLVDTQNPSGQWTYSGTSTNKPDKQGVITTGSSVKSKDSAKKKMPKEINNAGAKLAWENAVDLTGTIYILKPKFAAENNGGTDIGQRRPAVGGGGDTSNTQYGILGLIAAQMSGCVVPDGTWQHALNWFEQNQGEDGGFGYSSAVTRGGRSVSYGSMTTAGIVALASCYRYLAENKKEKKEKKAKNEKKPENDPARPPKLAAAVKWLADNFSVTGNPQKNALFFFYYLYGLERAGAFLETEKIGEHRWYDEGASWLVKNQLSDGSWSATQGRPRGGDVNDTCFAILFLKRATSEIIETGTSGGQPPIIEQK